MAGVGSSSSGAFENKLRSSSPFRVAVLRCATEATLFRLAALDRDIEHYVGFHGRVRELWRGHWSYGFH